jgi:hypothetical protein
MEVPEVEAPGQAILSRSRITGVTLKEGVDLDKLRQGHEENFEIELRELGDGK